MGRLDPSARFRGIKTWHGTPIASQNDRPFRNFAGTAALCPRPDFQANVERLRGKAEMHLKVLVDDICPGNSARDMTVGQQYLTSLRESASRQRERQSKARALSIQMHRMFLPLAEEITCKRMDTGKMLLDIAHLIDNKTVERYQNKYTSATQELKDCRMQLSGPWPPYHSVHRTTQPHQHSA